MIRVLLLFSSYYNEILTIFYECDQRKNESNFQELQVAEKKNLQQQLIIKETRKKLGDAKEENSKMRLDVLKLEMEKNDLTLALENLKLETENAKLEEKRKRSVRFSENGYAESSSYVFLKTRTEDKYVVVPKKMLAGLFF